MATLPNITTPKDSAHRSTGHGATGHSATRQTIIPGLLLCVGVTGLALIAQQAEAALSGRAWLEAVVLAILIGTGVRTIWTPPALFVPGVHFASKMVLEIAVALLGVTISFHTILAAGAPLLLGIVATVALSITGSFLLGRLFALPWRMAMLVACGNSICGNSAIAAVAPVIDAEGDDVAAAIAFTAVLGVAVVLLLPLIAGHLHLNPTAGGALAGLTVYAVPQVLAAAAPMGGAAVQFGTLVKLVRVLMLGPVVATLSLIMAGRSTVPVASAAAKPRWHLAAITHFLPWFILAFLAAAALRSLGVLPDSVVGPASRSANLLTIVAMAGLGLSTDLRQVMAAGLRVTAVVTLSLLLLGGIALLLLWAVGLAWGAMPSAY